MRGAAMREIIIHRMVNPESMAQLVGEFAALGLHRTGSRGDEATSAWLREWLARRGVRARAPDFPFARLECAAAYAEAGGTRIEGTPLYDGGATGPQGVEGPLRRDAAPGAIALAEDTGRPDLHSFPSLGDGATRPLAAIAVTGDPEGNVLLRNAERMASPTALPVLQVARRDAAPLGRAAVSGERVRVVIDFQVREALASNVVADIPAPAGDGLVVLMTPKSGWFRCAAERGGGIAIAMALAAAAAKSAGRRRDLKVLFTSGHELGHRGLLQYLGASPDLRRRARLWIQLGASIGARFPAGTRLFSREPTWRDWFPRVLARHGAGPFALADADVRPGGESREVFDHPFVALAGGHAYFHSPRDLPEVAVDAASVARYGAAFAELLEKALRG
jgi:hypothetical protein